MTSKKEGIGIDELAGFCKRKGFVYPSGEVYGGFAGFWDFGSLGVELVNNLKREWWKFHVQKREDVVGIDGSIVTNPKVWEASGHVGSFIDYFVYNKKTKEKKKVDKHELEEYEKSKDWEVKGEFNPMFTTQVGPGTESVVAYLRPETAQLIFANFKNVYENARLKLPCGIAQIGKAFRNEISPREFLFRAREFEQMEIEYFIAKGMKCPYMNEIKDVEIEVFDEDAQKKGKKGKKMNIYDAWKKGIFKRDWHAYWIASEFSWFVNLGAKADKFRVRQHMSEERSHYSSDTWDLEYEFPMGWRELQGFADRSNFDLSQHQKHSKKSFEIMHDDKKILPEVVCEPSLGLGRAFSVFMLDAYEDDKKRGNVVLHLNPKLAPVKAAIFPIVKKDEALVKLAREAYERLRESWNVVYDETGSIGRRYARQDEQGTPLCITFDSNSLEKGEVTVRDRDSTEQVVIDARDIEIVLSNVLNGGSLEAHGKVV